MNPCPENSRPEDNFGLTLKEAETFLRDVLQITLPLERLKSNRKAFLEDYTMAMSYHMPFQSISANAIPLEDRHVPTIAEIKRDVFSKLGGLCFTLNVFTWKILRILDFNATFVSCEFKKIPNAHFGVIVHDLTSRGSKHLVDIGMGFPIFRPIPLDFEGAMSPEYHDSFLRYRFIRDNDTVLLQHHIECHPQLAMDNWFENCELNTSDGWITFFRFHIEKAVDIKFFEDCVTHTYTRPDSGPMKITRCLAFPNGRFICILGTTLLTGNEDGSVQKSYMRSCDEILAAFSRHFPQFPEELVRKALSFKKMDFTKGTDQQ